MVKVLKLFAYIFFFVLALIYFIPKESVYYYVEKELLQEKVILSNEEIVDSGFSLELKSAKISYDSIQSANVESVNIKIFLLYNSLSLRNIELSSVVSSFIPPQVESVDVRYTIFNPLNITAKARGKFGEANAEVNILDRNISIVLRPSELMLKKHKSTLRNLVKNEDGEYEYDKIF